MSAQSSNAAKKDSTELAISYGAQAFDMLELYERLLKNQKAQTYQLGLANNEAQLQVEILKKEIKKVDRPNFWKRAWSWIKITLVAAVSFYIGSTVP